MNFLACAANVRRGDTTCTNHGMIPMLAANQDVLSKIEKELLTRVHRAHDHGGGEAHAVAG